MFFFIILAPDLGKIMRGMEESNLYKKIGRSVDCFLAFIVVLRFL